MPGCTACTGRRIQGASGPHGSPGGPRPCLMSSARETWFFLFSGLILVPGLIFIILTPITGGKQGLQFSVDYNAWHRGMSSSRTRDVSLDQVKAAFVANGVTDAADVSQARPSTSPSRTKNVHLFPRSRPLRRRPLI